MRFAGIVLPGVDKGLEQGGSICFGSPSIISWKPVRCCRARMSLSWRVPSRPTSSTTTTVFASSVSRPRSRPRATLWQERRDVNRDRPGFTVTVSAPTNAEAHDISLAIRTHRRAAGEIGDDEITIAATDRQGDHSYSLALAKGDRVRLFKRINATFAETSRSSNIGHGTVVEVDGVLDGGLMLRSAGGKSVCRSVGRKLLMQRVRTGANRRCDSSTDAGAPLSPTGC